MDAFSYLSVLLSIIIGLAITQVLQGYRGLLLSRSRVRLYAPPLIWSAMGLIIAAQLWWASFGLANHTVWDFATFGIILLQTILLYMMAAIVLPDIPPSDPLDLRAHYYREATPFFTFGLLMLAVSIVKDWMLNGELPSAANLAFHAAFAAIWLVAILTRRPRVHEMIAYAAPVAIAAYVGLLFARLGQG